MRTSLHSARGAWTCSTLAAAIALGGAGCVAAHEPAVRADLDRAAQRLGAPAEGRRPAADAQRPLRGVDDYTAYALEHSPELQASFERWRASVHRISRARRLPEPTLGYGFFVQNVETRVGPQRHRLSLQQTFPWPTKLTAGADAASAEARAIERRFDAEVLALHRRVAEAYWRLWLIRRTRDIQRDQLRVIRALSEAAVARLATGGTTLADQQQIDLSAARLEDALAGLDEAERSAASALRAAVGAPAGSPAPTPGEAPEPAPPSEPEGALRQAALDHPLLDTFALLREAREAEARSLEADRLPSFSVGVDWIETGEARMPGVPDSGKDAIIVGAGIKLPLWQGSYGENVRAAEAEARAQAASGRAAANQAIAELDAALATVNDATRRYRLHRDTLIPLAEAAYASVLGGYVTGRSTVAAAILAQRDLLDLRVGLERARAEHAGAWARLERAVGRPVKRAPSRGGKALEGRGDSGPRAAPTETTP